MDLSFLSLSDKRIVANHNDDLRFERRDSVYQIRESSQITTNPNQPKHPLQFIR